MTKRLNPHPDSCGKKYKETSQKETEFDFSNKPITMNDVINFIDSIKDFRVKGKLPFGTVDYLHMDDLIEYLKALQQAKKDDTKLFIKEIELFRDNCLCLQFKEQIDIDLFNEKFEELKSSLKEKQE